MNSSIGHLLILLFSTAVLIKEGASKTHHDEEKVEEGSQKTQEDEELEGLRGDGGRLLMTNPMDYGPPQVLPGSQYQQSGQLLQSITPNKRSHGTHSHARGEIQLELSDLEEEMGISHMRQSVDQLHRKVDDMSGALQDAIQQQYNDFNPAIQHLHSKADYLTQAVQTLFAAMKSLNTQMKTQQQLLQQSIGNKCDTRAFEQSLNVMHGSLMRVSQEVKEFKMYQSEAMKFILQSVTRNSDAMSFLQSGFSATYNSCLPCSVIHQPQPSQEQKVSEVVIEMFSTVANSLMANIQRVVHRDLEAHANTVMRYSAQENEEIKNYLLNLSQKMMDYRDEYLKRILDQSKNMEVIKKTVTETTQVMQKAAAGTQQAANQMAASVASAQRSLDSSSMCGGKK